MISLVIGILKTNLKKSKEMFYSLFQENSEKTRGFEVGFSGMHCCFLRVMGFPLKSYDLSVPLESRLWQNQCQVLCQEQSTINT